MLETLNAPVILALVAIGVTIGVIVGRSTARPDARRVAATVYDALDDYDKAHGGHMPGDVLEGRALAVTHALTGQHLEEVPTDDVEARLLALYGPEFVEQLKQDQGGNRA